MLLFREVYGWLRYLVSKDPICRSCGVSIEEIYSTYAPFSDTNDGVRTLVIHRVQDGMTPRIEYRAIGLHPQILWYPAGSSDGELLAVTNQFGFSGDYKSWDCSDACEWLLKAAQTKLCLPQQPQINLTVAYTNTVIDISVVKKILEAAGQGQPISQNAVNTWIKKNIKNADVSSFGFSVLKYFADGKISWKEVKPLIEVGILDWSWFKRAIERENLYGKFSPEDAAMLKSGGKEIPASTLKSHFDSILSSYTKGNPIRCPLVDTVNLGKCAIASFKSGELPYQYLQHLSLSDPYETVLPWSFIRRSILSYSKKIKAESKEDLPALILKWLQDSHLLLLLYKGQKEQEEALSKAVVAQIMHHIKQTLENDYWMRSLLGNISNSGDSKLQLQVEFDLWFLDALSPAIDRLKLPLSPHAFSVEKKDQDSYDQIYSAWVKSIKDYLGGYKDTSGQRLTEAFSKFFNQIITMWKPEEFKDYKAKIPSASKVIESIGNGTELLTVLCEDFEHEIGSEMPFEIKDSLLQSPYFYTIMHEVKIQGLRLD